MRIQFITEQIAVGGAMNDQSAFNQVKAKGVTHIIDLDEGCDVRWTKDIEVLHYYLPDDGEPKPHRWFAIPVAFALDVLRDASAKLFIHCAAGRNRSVSVAYAILRCSGYTEQESLNLIGFRYSLPLAIRDFNFKAIRGIRYKEDADRFIESRALEGVLNANSKNENLRYSQ